MHPRLRTKNSRLRTFSNFLALYLKLVVIVSVLTTPSPSMKKGEEQDSEKKSDLYSTSATETQRTQKILQKG
jgi:hypothetical protein